MIVGIGTTGDSFLPEAPAYAEALRRAGHHVWIGPESEVPDDVDVVIRFGGLLSAGHWSHDVCEIHEYHSASTGRLPRVKNWLKSRWSVKPAARMFLTPWVESQYSFDREVPRLYRDMGADRGLLEARAAAEESKTHDVVYAGSIDGRNGIVGVFRGLAMRGVSVAVAGRASSVQIQEIASHPGIDYLGVLSPIEVRELLTRARYGLNWVPDAYPFTNQTSTKVIEYLVAGVPIVSNDYAWIRQHSARHGYGFLDLADSQTLDRVGQGQAPKTLDATSCRQFIWDQLLLDCQFVQFVEFAAS